MPTGWSYTAHSILETAVSFLLARILSWFTEPVQPIAPGARVNHVRFGAPVNCDGVVVAVGSFGQVLVRWPRNGTEWLPRRQLVKIEE